MKSSEVKCLEVTRVVLCDTLCRTLLELRRTGVNASASKDEFLATAADIIAEAIAVEDVAPVDQALVAEAVLADLRFAFEEANRSPS